MTPLETQLYEALRALWAGKVFGKWSEEYEIQVEDALEAYNQPTKDPWKDLMDATKPRWEAK